LLLSHAGSLPYILELLNEADFQIDMTRPSRSLHPTE